MSPDISLTSYMGQNGGLNLSPLALLILFQDLIERVQGLYVSNFSMNGMSAPWYMPLSQFETVFLCFWMFQVSIELIFYMLDCRLPLPCGHASPPPESNEYDDEDDRLNSISNSFKIFVLRWIEILPINLNNWFHGDPTGRKRRSLCGIKNPSRGSNFSCHPQKDGGFLMESMISAS